MRSTRRCRAALLLLSGMLACAADTDSPSPEACSPDESPFLSADCLTALRGACMAHADESSCTTQPSFEFDGYTVECGWANVMTFADATSCTVVSEAGRCEATIVLLGGLAAPCTAIPSELEIIELDDGPLGPWSAVGDDSDYTGSCAPNVQPPAPPLCDCAPATCDVE